LSASYSTFNFAASSLHSSSTTGVTVFHIVAAEQGLTGCTGTL
jgi:hypothetical protein